MIKVFKFIDMYFDRVGAFLLVVASIAVVVRNVI